MSTSTFRQTVAEVAARAKERLPEAVNGRIEAAVKLVLAHDVMRARRWHHRGGQQQRPAEELPPRGARPAPAQISPRARPPRAGVSTGSAAGIDKRVRELLPVSRWTRARWSPGPTTTRSRGGESRAHAPAPRACPKPRPASMCHTQIEGDRYSSTLRDSDETPPARAASDACWRSTRCLSPPGPARQPGVTLASVPLHQVR